MKQKTKTIFQLVIGIALLIIISVLLPIIGISLLVFLPILFFGLLLPRLILYWRYKVRNDSIRKLGLKYNLQYKDSLPSFFLFLTTWLDVITINELSGKLNGKNVLVRNVIRLNWLNILLRYTRSTLITVNNNPVKGTLRSATLGSDIFLTTIPELDKFLEGLMDGSIDSEKLKELQTSNSPYKNPVIRIHAILLILFIVFLLLSLILGTINN